MGQISAHSVTPAHSFPSGAVMSLSHIQTLIKSMPQGSEKEMFMAEYVFKPASFIEKTLFIVPIV